MKDGGDSDSDVTEKAAGQGGSDAKSMKKPQKVCIFFFNFSILN